MEVREEEEEEEEGEEGEGSGEGEGVKREGEKTSGSEVRRRKAAAAEEEVSVSVCQSLSMHCIARARYSLTPRLSPVHTMTFDLTGIEESVLVRVKILFSLLASNDCSGNYFYFT